MKNSINQPVQTTAKPAPKVLTTLVTIAALGAVAQAHALPDQPKNWEKCTGVSKMKKNDCGALDGSHGCGGMAKEDGSDQEWIYVPEGTCEKLVGGTVVKVVPAK